MQYCPHCGKAIETGGAFCPHCGKALDKKTLPYKKLIVVAGVLAVIAIAAVLLGSFGKPFSEDLSTIDKASASVVTIYTYDVNGIGSGSGSGFAAFEEGIIVTNHHVIEGDTYSIEVVTEDGDVYTADSIICYDEALDIALLRVPDIALAPLPLGSTDLSKGETVTAIGSPNGIQNTVSVGIYSNRTADYGQDYLMTTASISPGSSGGALFNEKGKVIGITSAALTSGNDLYFTIPIEYVQELYNNRTADDELSIEAFRELSDHAYSVDYVLANARKLTGKTIEIYGYLSAVDYSGYLVSSPDLVLWLDTRHPDAVGDVLMEMLDAIDDQCAAGISLQVEVPVGMALKEQFIPGAYCGLIGKVMVYDENNRGTNIRFIPDEWVYIS